ncbi:4782_t:CDS:2 [Diversispora eburnea]|uniref:4782_t:CDS:1 n=1 Tax=Diversispora eburnea TaxID=1213867 RepID=A0A9N8WQF2_9GLOM|nr:4782_t:CDS:2 [Diversispora eburnea]
MGPIYTCTVLASPPNKFLVIADRNLMYSITQKLLHHTSVHPSFTKLKNCANSL